MSRLSPEREGELRRLLAEDEEPEEPPDADDLADLIGEIDYLRVQLEEHVFIASEYQRRLAGAGGVSQTGEMEEEH